MNGEADYQPRETGDTRSCWRCDGSGLIWWDDIDARGEHITREEVCTCRAGADDDEDATEMAVA